MVLIFAETHCNKILYISAVNYSCGIVACFRIEYLDKWCRDLRILYLQSNLVAKIGNFLLFVVYCVHQCQKVTAE